MKHIDKEELYAHLSDFLKTKGVELKEGSYSSFIHNGCKVLAEAINLSQQGVHRAKTGLDEKLDGMREFIHQKTAPRRPPRAPAAAAPAGAGGPAVETKPADTTPGQSPASDVSKAAKTGPAKGSKKAAQRPSRKKPPAPPGDPAVGA
jgi:hypothetical protein